MQKFKALFSRFWKDDTGAEALEYALIAGLVVIAAITVLSTVGTKVLARWQSLNEGGGM